MREKVGIQNIEKGFWKGLVSMSADHEIQLDEDGIPIETTHDEKPKADITSFQIIKKMMRVKARQEAVPASERAKYFVPKLQPEFTTDGKDAYYFDLKNNKEHYAMMTNDMNEE